MSVLFSSFAVSPSPPKMNVCSAERREKERQNAQDKGRGKETRIHNHHMKGIEGGVIRQWLFYSPLDDARGM